MDMQAMIDGMSARWQEERSKTQMTLGDLIDYLKAQDGCQVIQGFGDLDSYRGYYSDLAFEPTNDHQTCEELLGRCQSAMGEVFIGYKGGEYVMGRKTPLWISNYGTASGKKLMEIAMCAWSRKS